MPALASPISAKAAARDSADVQVKANSFTVACQDACSAGAITFGNLLEGLAVAVECAHPNALGAGHGFVETGDGQAPLAP